jgi:hypothetical protein
MEAEYLALAAATGEALWLRSLFKELGSALEEPLLIQVDNHSAIDFSYNSGYHTRSKHIDIRHHFVRDSITSNEVSVQHCASEDNVADIFTKPLPRTAHEAMLEKLGMTQI